MAKQRVVNTRFWDDDYIMELGPFEKLLFLYFLTNPLTDLCGAYEISMKRIAFDTGLKPSKIEEILVKFESAGKIVYRNGWVMIRNFGKHQQGNSPNVRKGAERSLNLCPDWVKQTLSNPLHSIGIENAPIPIPIPIPEPTEREAARPPSPPPADLKFEDSAFDHPAVVIYQEKFQVKVRTNFAKAVADRVKDLSVWTHLIADKIAWADEPLEKRQNVAKWILKAYDERVEQKRSGVTVGGRSVGNGFVPQQPIDDREFQKMLRSQQGNEKSNG